MFSVLFFISYIFYTDPQQCRWRGRKRLITGRPTDTHAELASINAHLSRRSSVEWINSEFLRFSSVLLWSLSVRQNTPEQNVCLAFLKNSVLAMQTFLFSKLLPNISQRMQKQRLHCWISFLRLWLGSIHFWKSTLGFENCSKLVIAYATLLLLKLRWRSDYWRIWDDCFTGWTTDRTNWQRRIFMMTEQTDPWTASFI